MTDRHIAVHVSPEQVARRTAGEPPLPIPQGHTGPFWIPSTGRLVWWTGRVAIGLRYQPAPRVEQAPQAASWVQALMLRRGGHHAVA